MYHDRTSSNYVVKHNFNAPCVFKHLFNTYLHKIEICNQIFMATYCRAANRIVFKIINKKVWIHSHWWPPWNNLMKNSEQCSGPSILVPLSLPESVQVQWDLSMSIQVSPGMLKKNLHWKKDNNIKDGEKTRKNEGWLQFFTKPDKMPSVESWNRHT